MGKFSRSSLAGRKPSLTLPDAYERVAEQQAGVTPTPVDAATQTIAPVAAPPAPTQEAPRVNPFKPQVQRPVTSEEAPVIPQDQGELVTQQQRQGRFDPNTGEYVDQTQDEALAAVSSELAAQESQGWTQQTRQNISAWSDVSTAHEAITNVEEGDGGGIDSIVKKGNQLNELIQGSIGEALVNPANKQVADYMASKNMLNPDGTVSRNLANAMALVAPQFMVDNIVDREDTKGPQGASIFDDTASNLGNTDESIKSTGKAFDPNQTQGNLLDAINSLLSPDQGDQGFYGDQDRRPRSLSDPGIQLTEAILWDVFSRAGMIDHFVPDKSKPEGLFKWNDSAREYRMATKKVVEKLNPGYRIDTSSIPTSAGKSLGKDQVNPKYKDISIKSKADKNRNTENKVKDTLGRIPKRVNKERFLIMLPVIMDVLGSINEQGFSDHPLAPVLRLGRKKYNKVYDKQKKSVPTPSDTEAAAATAESLKIEFEALENLINDVVDKSNVDDFDALLANPEALNMNVFYDKWMHAASNGRYHIMNTVLNMQDNKLARNLVESALNIKFKVGNGTREENNWKYIVSRNLKDFEGSADVENVGWNETTKNFDKNLVGWAERGRELREASAKGSLPSWLVEHMSKDSDKPHETWGYTVQSYLDAADYLDAKNNNGSFTPKAQTHHDGKQNGIAIQGIQTGNEDLMRRTGQIFDDEDKSVIPDGDIRDSFINNIVNGVKTVYAGNPKYSAAMSYALTKFRDADGGHKALRDFSKAPIMETSYGKFIDFHLESANDFLTDNPQVMSDFLSRADIDPNTEGAQLMVAKELNKVIAQTIKSTIDLEHQSVLKKAGRLWGALGLTPAFEGPLGNTIFMGTKAFVPQITADGDIVRVQFAGPEGVLEKQLGSVSSSALGYQKPRTVYGEDGYYRKHLTPEGSGTPNQFPVLTVQHIDAAVMADTILKVNKDIGNRVPHYMVPVHDAIITDASSVDKYHQQINRSFVEVNKNYSIAQAVSDGLQQAVKRTKDHIKDDQKYVLHPQVGEYQALYHYFNNIEKDLQDPDKDVSNRAKTFLQEAKKFGWMPQESISTPGDTWVTGKNLKDIINLVARKENAFNSLNKWAETVKTNKPKALERVRKDESGNPIVYQYN